MKELSKDLDRLAQKVNDRKLTEFLQDDKHSLNFNQMERDRKLHKECTAKKCVAGNKHIESCHNEISDNHLLDTNTKPF